MNAVTTKQLRKFNQHLYDVEVQELSKLIKLVKQQDEILEKEGATSIAHFEFKLVENSPFTSAKLAALDAGKEDVLNELHRLEQELDGRISKDDLTKNYSFKNSFLNNLKEKYSEYYSEQELEVKKLLNEAITTYNAIPFEYRKKILIDRQGNMIMNPFNRL